MRPDARQRGFGLVAALFIIIVIAAVIAVMARLSVTQSATNSMGLQQARAYQMAQAGLEWGIARAVAGQSCAGSLTLEGFSIAVTCAATSAGAVAEENKTVNFRQITATAQYAAAGSPDYAYRQLTAVVELP
ncbi:hypothetical protein [Pseudomonas mangrovi]|jgi:MSHA biogenesis protein MshP|uniref:Pilus assembly protein MshP n=1 Tax=Pseudomonas mangrovi TaxID=2161748 RepID=A0A2T5P923_9PSED|nr:hypothetical protein [Pseudomonas mangrovi]PTU74239.1 hypothetical protein DBO85_09030 [Pseudomonas mangrovi]